MKTNVYNIPCVQGHEAEIEAAAQVIREGGLVAIPTETVYGLGADALNEAAVAAIYQAKGRPSDNPLIIHVPGAHWLERYCVDVPQAAYDLAEKFWPGPLTMILPRKDNMPDRPTGGLNTVGVRCPDHPVTLAIIEAAGVPIAAPSANTSGRPSCTNAQDVLEDMNGKIPAIVDGGPCAVGVESTILDLTVTPPQLLRPGGMPLEALEAVVGEISVDHAVTGQLDLDGLSVQTDDLHALLQELDQSVEAGSIETESINALMGALSDLENQINEELAASQDDLEAITSYASPADFGDLDLSGDASLIENELVMVLDNTARTVSKLEVSMGKIDNVLSDSYENLNSGMRSTLEGTAQLLENLTAALQKTQNIKANEQVISDLVDKNWQKLDDELGILDMDPSARKPSFTSTRNPEPESVQVILRTEAITKPDTPAEEVDESGDNRTFLQRLGDVFQTIWDSITGLFD